MRMVGRHERIHAFGRKRCAGLRYLTPDLLIHLKTRHLHTPEQGDGIHLLRARVGRLSPDHILEEVKSTLDIVIQESKKSQVPCVVPVDGKRRVRPHGKETFLLSSTSSEIIRGPLKGQTDLPPMPIMICRASRTQV